MSANYHKKKYKSIIRELGKSDSTKDRIFAYYLDKKSIQLTKKEEEIRNRWASCFSLLCQYHSPQQAVNVMVKTYAISEAQAYRDVKNALELFGDVTSSNKEAYRHILFEFAMKIFQLAATKTDLPEMNRALITMVKIRGLDKEDPNLPDFSAFQNNTYNILIQDSQREVLERLTSQGLINIDEIHGKEHH